jgi:hypothetical protein
MAKNGVRPYSHEYMRSIIAFLIIPVLAAFVPLGCNKNAPSNSTGTQ